jgi:MFS family permease
MASLAQLLGSLGTFLVMLTQILVFQRRGAAGYEVAALVICEALPMVVLGKPIGRLVDRVDSRLLLVAACVAQALACVALAQASAVPAVLAGMLALSVASAVSTPTRQALLPAMVTRDDLARANAVGQTAGTIGMTAGPALAGFLVGTVGPQPTVRWAALGFLATAIAAFAIRTRRGGKAVVDRTATASSLVDDGWTLRRDRMLRTSAWGLTAVITAVGAVNVVLVFFVMGTLHSTPQTYGVIDASWTVGLLGGAWLFGLAVRPRTSDPGIARALILSTVVICVAIVAVSTVHGPWWIVPCYLVGGAGNGGLNVLAGTLLGRRVPASALGRASTALAVRIQAGSVVGYIAGGLVLAVVQPRWIVLSCGLLGLLVALAVLPLVSRAGRPARTTAQALPAPQPVPAP